MADIIKVKPKKNYEWNQDKKYINIQIPYSGHLTLKNINIQLTDLNLKITSQQIKPQFLDLYSEVDYTSPENRFVLNQGYIVATLKKKEQNQWPSLLIENISIADKKKRRQQSQARFQQYNKKKEEIKDNLRVQYDRKATQQLMRFQQEERQKLEARKKQQKQKALEQIYKGIDQTTGNIKKQNKFFIQRQEEKWQKKQKLALQILQNEQHKQTISKNQQKQIKNKSKIVQQISKQISLPKNALVNNTMFTNQQINKNQEAAAEIEFQQIPIRKAATQKVKFTQKVYPHLATRDTFYKQPPIPKNNSNKSTGGDIQSKNPLWLKDKGDGFIKNKNYISALQAYNEAIKLDDKMLKAYLNRSLTFMKMFKYQQALNDCQQCLLLLRSQISSEQNNMSSKIILGKIMIRKGVCQSWKGQLELSKKTLQQALQLDISQQINNQVKQSLARIQKRQNSIKLKIKGDQLVKLNNYNEAIQSYNKSIELDSNQYSVSNKCLCLNKLKKYKQCIQISDIALQKIRQFNINHTSLAKQHNIFLKIYFRKAKAYQELQQISLAEENARKGLLLDPNDKDLQQLLKTIKKKNNKNNFLKLKQSAKQSLQNNQPEQALQYYVKSLKLLDEHQDIQQYLSVLQNQCVCYQKLQKYSNVVDICNRILAKLNNYQSKVLNFGGKIDKKLLQKEEINNISYRTLMRRANSNIKLQQYYNAKFDFQKAIQLNISIQKKKQAQNLKKQLEQKMT